jgi:ABC-type phosphate transport system substrate-binding protein
MKPSFRIVGVLLLGLLIQTVPSNGQVALIANKSVSIASIDRETLKNIYTLESKNIGSLKVVLFDLRDDGVTKSAFYGFMGTTPYELRKSWLRAKLTGTGEPPTLVSEEDICNKVANTPGSIGYVSTAKTKDNIQIIMNIE